MEWSEISLSPKSVALFLVGISLCISWLRFTPNVPSNLPWAGQKGGNFLWRLRAAVECLQRPLDNLYAGYEKVSLARPEGAIGALMEFKYHQKGKSYIFPTLRGASLILIPQSSLRWLIDYPDTKASVSEAHYELLAGQYAFTDSDILKDPFHETVIHLNMTRKLASLIPGTWDEVQYQIDEAFGMDSANWKEFKVSDTMTSVVTAISNLLLVGQPLCRNKRFQNIAQNFTLGVVASMTLIPLFPRWFKPIGGYLLSIPNHIFVWQSKKYLIPLIKQRIQDMETDANAPVPEDYITWHIRSVKEKGLAKEFTLDRIARRVMPLEFAAIHTSSLSITNVLLDLAGSDPKLGYIDSIREEIQTVYENENQNWSKQALTKLVKTDSAIRESMRISGFITRGMQRKVLDKNGLRSEEGWVAPYGSMIATDVYSRHHDPSVYPNPAQYDAFRFSRSREEAENHLKAQNLSLISTGENFLPFGHGRHACPGRFFINIEFKLLLAHILMNYDIEPLSERPANVPMGESLLPPRSASIRVKRKA